MADDKTFGWPSNFHGCTLKVDQRLTSSSQGSGITSFADNQFGLAPKKRSLSNAPNAGAFKRDLLTKFSRDKALNVHAVAGDAEAYEFAQEILYYLQEHGFEAFGVDQVAMIPSPKGVKINPASGDITVGHK